MASRDHWRVPFVAALLLVPVLVPGVGGRYDAEWIAGVLITYADLLLVLGLLWIASRRWPNLGIGIALGLAIGAEVGLTLAEWRWAPELLHFEAEVPPTLAETIAGAVLFGFMVFGLWVLAVRYPAMLRRAREDATEAQRLREEADRQEMQARLAPHFLLNSLNTVAALVTSSPEMAREVLAALGDLLRGALAPSRGQRHTVSDEVKLVKGYARILEARFGPRKLAFEWNIEASVAGLDLPPLLLQPIIENAVEHGALRQEGPATVQVSAKLETEGDLIFEVRNPGVFDPSRVRERTGVDLVRQRLALLGPNNTFTLTPEAGQTVARLCIRKPA